MYNQRIKLRQNIDAIKVAIQSEYTQLTKEEIEVASRFSGWGGIKCVLLDPYKNEDWEDASEADKSLRELVRELHQTLKIGLLDKEFKRAIDSIKNATLSSFFTPNIIPQVFYEVLSQYTDVQSIYEPSAGAGVFVKEFVDVYHSQAQKTLYEKDIITAKVLKVIMQGIDTIASVKNIPFEESSDNENGNYDLCISNVPFGDLKIYDPKFTDRNITNRIHNYFICKMIDKVREGGVVAVLINSAYLDTVSNRTARRYVLDRCDLLSVVILPDNLFSDIAGTMAPSHFLVVRKNSSKTCLSPEEELLCESEFIEGPNGKYAQNKYITKVYREDNPRTSIVVATEVVHGKNQYGKAAIEVHWDHPIEEIESQFREILSRDLQQRWMIELYSSTPTPEDMKKEVELFKELERSSKRLREKLSNKEDTPPWEEDVFTKEEAESIIEHIDEVLGNKVEDNCTNSPVTGHIEEPVSKVIKCDKTIEELLPKYVPFKDGILIEKDI